MVFVEHDETRVKWLLEKFFSNTAGSKSANLGLSVGLMAQHGFQMEYRADVLAKIAGDPGCHPAFDNFREYSEEETKDASQFKAGSKTAEKREAQNTKFNAQPDNSSGLQPPSKQKGHKNDPKTDQAPTEQWTTAQSAKAKQKNQ